MIVIFAIYLLLCLIGIRKYEFHKEYISLECSNAIKGACVGLVFFRHFKQYVELGGMADILFGYADSMLGQMIVVPFLFYSGYGVTCAVLKKGADYVKSIPKQRALKVWVHYVLAVLLFLVANIALGKTVKLKRFVLTLLCWNSIGNSNWYIMAIVVSYLFTYVAFRLFLKKPLMAAWMQTVLTLVAAVVLAQVQKDCYYNTLLSFTAGIWYALYKEKAEDFLGGKSRNYYFSLAACAFICLITNWKREWHVSIYEVAAITFALTVVLLTMKWRIGNPILQYMGNHVFSLYILQRLPMLCLSRATELEKQPYLFFAVSVVLTFIISYLFDMFLKRFDMILFRTKIVPKERTK